ncbi:DUF1365 domain-containing protein [Inquilinus sp.]|jgi:DUF1365 family protein|uniref:DUF1365 domain-containing protein n=1 Tax=Inquilinus sp. TaxID=1932117 RepID=UPI003784CE82
MNSALYHGRVVHARSGAVRHRFAYRVFSLLLDLDELPQLGAGLRGFGYNRRALLSFRDRDHGPRDGSPLRPWVERVLAPLGLGPIGRVRLLCFPRLFGYVFNPLSIYYCDDAGGRLAAIIYEVRNTFGEMHCYAVPVDPARRPAAPVLQSCGKEFYVSPFIAMQAHYRFRLSPPEEGLSVLIRQSVAEGEVLVASLVGRRAPLTDGGILRAVLRHPLVTLKVIGAIHWQALRLWRKGVPLHRHTPAPAQAISVFASPDNP